MTSVECRPDGPLLVFSLRHHGPSPDELRAEVASLLDSVGRPDGVGWLTHNLAAALAIVGADLTGWEGEEWAIDLDADPAVFADADAPRTPFSWLRARTAGSADVVVTTYPADDEEEVFGLSLAPDAAPVLSTGGMGGMRPRPDVDLLVGPVVAVDVVLDTSVAPVDEGVVTRLTLHGEHRSIALMAAEALAPDRWQLLGESVTAVRDASAAASMTWTS